MARPAGSADYTVLLVFLVWGLVFAAVLTGRLSGGLGGGVSLPMPALFAGGD